MTSDDWARRKEGAMLRAEDAAAQAEALANELSLVEAKLLKELEGEDHEARVEEVMEQFSHAHGSAGGVQAGAGDIEPGA